MTTFATILSGQLQRDPGRPLVTFYDHSSGERTELSVTTYANWVAKTASLLTEEYDLERGQRVRLDLPVHWLGPVLLGAAWSVGLVVTGDDDADLIVCGPDSVARWAEQAADVVVLATALHPLGRPFDEPLPTDVHDLGVEVWAQPDAFIPYDPPGPEDAAVDPDTGSGTGSGTVTHAELWEVATAGSLLADGGRLFSGANPASPSGLATFTEPLVKNGSVVLVAHPDPARVEQTYDAERATARA